jgi:hypothetical protein
MVHPLQVPSEEQIRELTADANLSTEKANQYADLFIASGKLAIALLFLERSKDKERLGRIKNQAISSGDAFLLHCVERIVPGLVQTGEWQEAGAQAMSSGKFLFARDCYEKAGDGEKSSEARSAWLKIFPR